MILSNLGKIKKNIIINFILILIFGILFHFLIKYWIYNFHQINEINYYSNQVDLITRQLANQDLTNITKEQKNLLNQLILESNNFINIFKYNSGGIEAFMNYIVNIYLIQHDVKHALQFLTGNDSIYYYNLGNIYLRNGDISLNNQKLGSGIQDMTGKMQLFQFMRNSFGQSINNYKRAELLLNTGINNSLFNKIQNNKTIAENFFTLTNLQICFLGFQNIFENFTQILTIIDDLFTLYSQQIKIIPSWSNEIKDKKLLECLQNYFKSLQQSSSNILNIQDMIKDYQNQADKKFTQTTNNLDLCPETENWSVKMWHTLQNIQAPLASNLAAQKILVHIFLEKNISHLDILCQNSQKYSNKVNANNEQLMKGLQELADNFSQSQDRPSDKPRSETGFGTGEYQDKNQNSTPEYNDILDETEKDLRKLIEKKNEQRIEDMQNMKRKGYQPQEYLNKIFQDFLGAKKYFQNSGYDSLNRAEEW